MDRDFSFLKKQTRAHKYYLQLSRSEVKDILERYVPRLREVRILATSAARRFPEVRDEHDEIVTRIITEAKQELQKEFYRHVKLPDDHLIRVALKTYFGKI